MKDQNLRTPILLKGIDRRPQDAVADGSLLELLNLRYTDNALRPVLTKERLTSFIPQFDIRFKHVISETVFAYWGIVGGTLAAQVYENNSPVGTSLIFDSITGEAVFAAVGNSVLISNIDAEWTYIYLYEPDTNTYRTFSKKVPDLPFVSFQRVVSSDDDEDKQLTQPNSAENADLGMKGLAQDQYGRMTKKGYMIGWYLVRVCWELFDGSLVMHSIPIPIQASDISVGWHTETTPDQIVISHSVFTGYKLQYKLNIPSADLATLKTKYTGVVRSLNFYITNHKELDEKISTEMTEDVYESVTNYGVSASKIHQWINDELLYFEYKKISLENLESTGQTPGPSQYLDITGTWVDIALDDSSTLSASTPMTVGGLSIHSLFAKSLFSYNQRIFQGNIKNRLYFGTSAYGIAQLPRYGCTGTRYSIGFSFDLDTADGTRRVFTGWTEYAFYVGQAGVSVSDADIHTVTTIGKTGSGWTVNAYSASHSYVGITGGTGEGQTRRILSNTADTLTVDDWVIEPDATSDFIIFVEDYWDFYINAVHTLGYPDQRAKSMIIWHKDNSNVIHRLKNMPLTPAIGMNFSFIVPVNFIALGASIADDPDNSYVELKQSTSDWVEEAINADETYNDPDRIQATEFQNPFYNPAANSYRTDGFVLGMATNAVPLGSSQFGQYPLFAFTTKGIWALNIGNGDILIDSITPLNEKICTNSKSIVGIDGGVLFQSSEGLIILSGRNPVLISEAMQGLHESPLSDIASYEKLINNPNTYQPKAYLDTVDFNTYAQAANFAFVTVITRFGPVKEVIVSNPNYVYSYLFNVATKTWTKITQSWDRLIPDYPKTYGTKLTGGIYYLDDLTNEPAAIIGEQPAIIHLETRPVKFSEEVSWKKIQRALLYGWITPILENPFTFAIFGTTDRKTWVFLSASSLFTTGEKTVLGRSSFSCIEFIIIAGGNVYDDTYITGIIADIEKRYNNKLR